MAVVSVAVMIIIVTVSRQQINKIMINSCRYTDVKRKRPKNEGPESEATGKQPKGRGRTKKKNDSTVGRLSFPRIPGLQLTYFFLFEPLTSAQHSLFWPVCVFGIKGLFGLISNEYNIIISFFRYYFFFFWAPEWHRNKMGI